MHYRHLKKICQRTNKLTFSEKSDILRMLLGESFLDLTSNAGILFKLCQLDTHIYMSNMKKKLVHDYLMGGNERNPIIYLPIYIHDGHFTVFVAFGLTELCEMMIKNDIYIDFNIISYGELMRQYRCYLYNDLKNDKNIRYANGSKFHLSRSFVRLDIANIYTTEAILEYNKLKYLRYGNNFDKKICCSSKCKKSLGVHV